MREWTALLAVLLSPALAREGRAQWDWKTDTPGSHGFSKERLDRLRESVAERRTKALLVIRNDRIVYEWYAEGHERDKRHYTASMAKALVGGVSLAVAVNDDLIKLDDPAWKYVPGWKDDPKRSRIAVRHLGSHTSGIEDAEADGKPHRDLTGWKGDFWKRKPVPDDPFTIARDRAPLLFKPGEDFQYSNPGIAMLGYVVTAAVKDGAHKDVRTLLRERIMRPIGVPDGEWACGYGKTFVLDGLPHVGNWGGGSYTARAVARVARLMLREGDWEGKRLLSADSVRAVTADAGTPGHGGMGWWSNKEGHLGKAPRDAYCGAGAGHQVVLVLPGRKAILVRNGGSLDSELDYFEALRKHLFDPWVSSFEE